ncbi:MAG: pyrroline-5-carboxylate reductase [Planctomycetaceae bacterium]|jgi:pyrroline-5-carboxylate reductase|nr:pyrroline-5-carboxylate reductase [Planctomycetaceae bacterium]
MIENIKTPNIGFLGAGQMATALAVGFTKSGIASGEYLFVSDVITASAERFVKQIGAALCRTNVELAQKADVLFLAVKPQQMNGALTEIAGKIRSETLVVSIAAGLPLAFFQERLGADVKIVRVMPNMPCLVGKGSSAFTALENVSRNELTLVKTLLETVGVAEQLPEKLLDAATGLSASGPAFVCMIIEALSDGGVKMGLPRALATQFAAQTLLGTAAMALETREHPAVLKDRVASPAGTTIAGIHVLEERGVRAAMIAAIEAATQRSAELAQSYGGRGNLIGLHERIES